GWVAGLAGVPATARVPEVALKSTVEPNASCGLRKPRARAVRSVSTISSALSELGSLPAITVTPGALLRGGSETSAPVGRGSVETERGVPSTPNVPLIATCPQAARTCSRLPSVTSVPELNPTGLAPPDG